jgi:NCS1 family nucleobase:cation symporter-1
MERTHPSIVLDGVAAEEQTLAAGTPFWVFFVLNTGIAPWLSGVIVAGMGLGLGQAIAVIVLGSFLGAALPAATALAGPASGLSQIESGRWALGAAGNRLPALANWIGAIGWDVIFNTLSAAALVALLARWGVDAPMWAVFAGLVVVQLVIGIWGHHLIQITAHWTGLVLGLAFVGIGGAALVRTGIPAGAGTAGTAEIFAALLIVVSFSITLAPYASDYTRYLPHATPARRVFGSVFSGLSLGSILFMGFGWATAALVAEPSPMGVMAALADLSGPLAPLVLLVIAVNSVPCNAVNDNSAAYCLISAGFRVSRPVAAVIGAALGYVVCLAASESFIVFFENFLFLFAHGIAPWAAILIVHKAIRGARPGATPEGFTGGAVIFVAVTTLSVLLFSANSLWTGFLSTAVGGADIGPYLGFVVAGGLEAMRLRFAPADPA